MHPINIFPVHPFTFFTACRYTERSICFGNSISLSVCRNRVLSSSCAHSCRQRSPSVTLLARASPHTKPRSHNSRVIGFQFGVICEQKLQSNVDDKPSPAGAFPQAVVVRHELAMIGTLSDRWPARAANMTNSFRPGRAANHGIVKRQFLWRRGDLRLAAARNRVRIVFESARGFCRAPSKIARARRVGPNRDRVFTPASPDICPLVRDRIQSYGMGQKRTFLRFDNVATVRGRKAYDMSKVSEFCLEKTYKPRISVKLKKFFA